jgi:GNAT superfamily N-acetyltransferase
MTPAISLVPLRGLEDPHLLPWMELYELSFPPAQRLLISTMLAIARRQTRDDPQPEWLLTALAGEAFAGLVHYATFPALGIAGLWGLATPPALRGQGLGAEIYMALRARLATEGYRVLLLEVERPDVVESEVGRQLAERRIGFYRRLGARLLTGIEYMQRVGPHQPPVPMHIMLDCDERCAPDVAFGWARALFHDAAQQTGELGLA